MARAKTGIFYIKAIIDVDATVTTISEDLSVYVNPVNRQGLLIRSVDYIWYDSANNLPMNFATDGQFAVQVHETTLGIMADYDNSHMIASGSLFYDSTGILTNNQDFFPDRLGHSKGEGRVVVNDSLEIVSDGAGTTPANLQCCVVLECQVIKLTERDYITLALQSVADN